MFTVWLKRADAPVPARVSMERPQQYGAKRRGLALVADDEPMLRVAAEHGVRSLGFDVVLADNGEHALQRFDKHADQLTLVVLDLTMPKLSGVEALRRIRERRPHLPTLCVSGYKAELVASEINAAATRRAKQIPMAGNARSPGTLRRVSAT